MMLLSALLNILIDALFPIGAERSAGADGAHGFADDFVVKCGAHFVTFIVHCAV